MFSLRGLTASAKLARALLPSVRPKHTHPGERMAEEWVQANDKVFEPLKPDDKWRPAFVCLAKKDIWYSYKKLYKVACFVRGMSVDEAVKQLNFCTLRGAKMVKEAILEAQELAVKEHSVQYKSFLWVAESTVVKTNSMVSSRRHRGGRRTLLTLQHCNYLVRLEEGHPPEHYYYHQRPLTGQELLDKWMSNLRKRKVSNSL